MNILDIPAPPDDLVRWSLAFVRHVAPWLVRGLFVAHVALYLILFIQRRKPESRSAAALRRFVVSKAGLWFLIAVGRSGPWWIVGYAVVVTWIAATTAVLLAMMIWNYVIPSLWPQCGGSPEREDMLAKPQPWDGINRRVGPRDRRLIV
jgi:hypothetical protein